MRFDTVSLIVGALSALTSVSAQSVVGSAYGFATGVTGGGSAAAVTPSSVEELEELLADDTPRTIVIDKTWDFTGKTTSGPGCDRKSCSASNGGQLYLGTLSCGGSDNVAVDSITYDVAGTEPLIVGSNKSIIGAGGKGVLNGKGIRVKEGASNVILQGFEITNLNPGIVWGGDAIDLHGDNDGVWIDHMKVSLIGRMFLVTHYNAARVTISNSEFDGRTTTSASCNDNHYWTMMFYGNGDQVTLDRNYFHDVAGRAPKLGEPEITGTFQASNNLFENMKGHAFDIYPGADALIEGNVFNSVKDPMTDQAATVSSVYNVADASAASACSSTLGRACEINSFTSSGEWPSLSGNAALSALAKNKDYLVTPVAASEVASLVSSSVGPANLGSGSGAAPAPAPAPSPTQPPAEEEEAVETPQPSPVEEDVETPQPTPVEEDVETPAPAEPSPAPANPAPAPDTGAEAGQWGQCGGQNWTGATKCAAGTSCVKQNDWYSQCLTRRAARKARFARA